jgi:menaquinone-dependent protoporphyrinogen oxidase
MSVLVAFATKYGTTRRIAEQIASEVPGGKAVEIGGDRNPDPARYDLAVVGGPVYAGKILSAVPSFCEANRDALSRVPVALFVSCLYQGEQAVQQLESAFPSWLLSRAFGKYTVGGEVRFDELGFFHRLVMRGVMKTTEDVSALDESGIRRLISEVRARVTA